MLWLFGQIWLWLLIAFALGCGVTWLMMRGERREPAPYEQAPPPRPAVPPQPEAEPVPAPLAAEQTQFIPPARIHDEDEPYDQEAEGHREGQLIPEPVRPAQVYYPDPLDQGARNSENGHEPEPVWPSDEDWPPAERASEHRPGHGH